MTIQSIVITIMIVAVGILITTIVAIRLSKPHSKRMNAEQSKVDRKTKITSATPEAAKTNGKNVLEYLKEKLGMGAKLFWSLVFVAIAIVLFYLSQQVPDLRPAQVGDWSQNHWPQVLILWCLGAVLIALNAEEKSVKTLQEVLAGGVFILLFVLPIWSWIVSPSTGTASSSRAKMPVSQMQTRNTVSGLPRAWNKDGTSTDTATWLRMPVPAHADSVHIPVFSGHLVWFAEGMQIRCVYSDGYEGTVGDTDTPCRKEGMIETFVRNDTDMDRQAIYAYADQNEK